ncbi:MAG TPA: saccharopine dehydrogenase NADP-binding domain-containing protein [Hyphomicrobiaceae bacterium]|jgi:saccharopine dehydrogenase-like NADP-dependent oxidoreductase
MPTVRGSRVVVLGGYGAFGARVSERLAASPGLELVVAGRSRERAERFARELAARSGASVGAGVMDAESITADHLMAERASLVINASGPFQTQDYRVARAAIDAGAHYVDLADARGFVTGIGALDGEASERAFSSSAARARCRRCRQPWPTSLRPGSPP